MALEYYGHTNIRTFKNIDNFMYFYHLDSLIILPTYPDSITDTMSVNFNQSSPLGRSAPIYSYSSSGPRVVRVDFKLHRDMMKQINYGNSALNSPLTDDLVDMFVKHVQAAAVPEYAASAKMVNPPIVAVKFGQDVFCKGVVTGAVSVTYDLPILENGKYATIGISFDLSEIEPYSASDIWSSGSFRGVDANLERNIYTMG